MTRSERCRCITYPPVTEFDRQLLQWMEMTAKLFGLNESPGMVIELCVREDLRSRQLSYMHGYMSCNEVALSYINASSPPILREGVHNWNGHSSRISEEIAEHIAPSTTAITTFAASARRRSLTAVAAPRIFRLAPRVRRLTPSVSARARIL
jgi:hypothetical protein